MTRRTAALLENLRYDSDQLGVFVTVERGSVMVRGTFDVGFTADEARDFAELLTLAADEVAEDLDDELASGSTRTTNRSTTEGHPDERRVRA